MKKIIAFAALLFLAACGENDSYENEELADSLENQPVKILPSHPELHDMPVQPMDTTRSDMPVVDPDTGNVTPL